jgi:hypothetical protein
MNKAKSFAVLLGGLLLMIFSATAPSGGGLPPLGNASATGLEMGGFMAFVVGFLGLARSPSSW